MNDIYFINFLKKKGKIHHKVPEIEYFFQFFEHNNEKIYFDPGIFFIHSNFHATNLENFSCNKS